MFLRGYCCAVERDNVIVPAENDADDNEGWKAICFGPQWTQQLKPSTVQA